MARDRRGYFYRSRRVNGRVARDYFGNGIFADLAEHMLKQARAKREAADVEAAALRAALEEAEQFFRAVFKRVDLVASGSLIVAGYHRHDRGEWRRRRHGAT